MKGFVLLIYVNFVIFVNTRQRKQHLNRGAVFFLLGGATLALSRASAARSARNPVHISTFLADDRSRGIAKGEISSPLANTLVPLPKNSTSFILSNFFIQAAGLAYHHDAVVDIIKGALRPCISSAPLGLYLSCGLMIYNTPC